MFDKNLLEQFKTNRGERMGTLFLVILMVITVVTCRFFNNKDTIRAKTNPELVQLLDEYYTKHPIVSTPPNIKKKSNSKNIWSQKPWPKKKKEKVIEKVKPTLFKFDPNTIEYKGLISLGFTSRQANTLIKFRESGFEFRKPNDLIKVHGLDSTLLARIESYIELPKQKAKPRILEKIKKDTLASFPQKIETPFQKIEINNATSEDLIAIKGIGKVYASIVLKYRDRLGGYIDLNQIGEAYEFQDTTLRLLEKFLTIDSASLNKININQVTFKELLSHPYITFEQNQIIFPYITTRRPIDDLDILNNILLIDKNTINRLKPYLTTQ